ncbi:MAG TPA: ATP-binding protein [Puia sp.]|nr:ATP-binding protein [Puia sp.]
MKMLYFVCLGLGAAFFFLLVYPGWLALAAVVITILFGAYYFYMTRLQGAELRNVALQQEVQELKVQLDSSIVKEQEACKEADTEKSIQRHLLATVDHEIRAPMNGILGMTTLLTNSPLNKEQRECVETIRNSGESMLTSVNAILVDDLLNFSKSDPAGGELEKRDFELHNCVEESLMAIAGTMEEGAPELVYCIDTKVPGEINGDRKRLSLVLINLLENAVRHTRKGEIFLGIRKLGSKKDNKIELAFEISDTGTGIPASKMDQLFKGISSQAANGVDEMKPAGLGLAVCKKLVELMGGKISVLSEPGRGAKFTFNILCNPALMPKHLPVHPGFSEAGNRIVVSRVKDKNNIYSLGSPQEKS